MLYADVIIKYRMVDVSAANTMVKILKHKHHFGLGVSCYGYIRIWVLFSKIHHHGVELRLPCHVG